MRRDISFADFNSDESADNLRDNRTRSQKGDSNGNEHTSEIRSKPGREPANGERNLANTSPIPEALIIPINIATKAMKGRMVLITVSIASRPA